MPLQNGRVQKEERALCLCALDTTRHVQRTCAEMRINMADKIQNAYETSKNIYDGVLTQGNFFSRLYIKLFWSGTDDNEIARKVLAYIPDDFSGNLLDVPVGTAVFTAQKWISMKNAHITCLDYSIDMLEQARKRLNSHAHINCIQGDVGNLL